MLVFTAAVIPGQSLGFFALGTPLFTITQRLKADTSLFPRIDITSSSTSFAPIILTLPANGIRFRFDGPSQTLRLIEVLDFSKNKITYKNEEIGQPTSDTSNNSPPRKDTNAGPSFKHIYSRIFGPTFPGEYQPPTSEDYGMYSLSYPGLAFTFPVAHSTWDPSKDFAAILSSPTTKPATSMAIFHGQSWPEARPNLFSGPLPNLGHTSPSNNKTKDTVPDEIAMVHILGGESLRLDKANGVGHLWIQLGRTTPQELVAELGPPDAIYRKSDQQLAIHGKDRGVTDRGVGDVSVHSDSETESSTHTGTTTASESDSDTSLSNQTPSEENGWEECFYNYFYQGLDILISSPSSLFPPRPSPSSDQTHGDKLPTPEQNILPTSAPLVATKIILHGNVPGTYAFDRHRRIRWTIDYLRSPHLPPTSTQAITSETPFPVIAEALHQEWASTYSNPEEAMQRTRGMVLNRGWGDTPGSSVEFLGGWEESSSKYLPKGKSGKEGKVTGKDDGTGGKHGLGTTTLYGWPGLVFEVASEGVVSELTVF